MTIDEYNKLKVKHNKGQRKPPSHIEGQIQRACVRWFRFQFRKYRKVFFAVPNGGRRDKKEAAIMKAEGTEPGVSDLILLLPRKGFSSLCIEMKTEDGEQSGDQVEFQRAAESFGSKYVICRSVEEFMKIVNWYLK